MISLIESADSSVRDFISQTGFPCAGAKTALNRNQIKSKAFSTLDDATNNLEILHYLYQFIHDFSIDKHMYSSFVCVFDGPYDYTERYYEKLLWQKLQQLHDIDSRLYSWDSEVSSNPEHNDFSFSLGGEAFFIICLNPSSLRKSRRFEFPSIVFNLHQQFEKLRSEDKFDSFQQHIRQRDKIFNGQENPMLNNHGCDSEARQYSGRSLEPNWKCPLHVRQKTSYPNKI
ncbi:YqcI/YcgG family protein [Salinimonas sp. HHU 13199]|uniref:YqcI/YcgG family protein n=1 Tax=Salinimonas profundi TaxID=2729140 RepID=A0ABR8LJ59_9ALTE|nr:guanitoxin biosynthesis heme-dependent pre-guanitoxin N-hydroxylase GntA [Salinimonas profundi]MBD3584120.1 YqcI/YcgG family protein [Salinimonas profundi]